ncbi:MAG: hypothetical protein ACYS5V_14890, partial [Planctomycetota bacterium]
IGERIGDTAAQVQKRANTIDRIRRNVADPIVAAIRIHDEVHQLLEAVRLDELIRAIPPYIHAKTKAEALETDAAADAAEGVDHE